MRHRRFVILLSAFADLLVIGAIVMASGLASDVLPVPHRLLAAPVERVVQLPDIPLPAAPRRDRAARVEAQPATESAPVEPEPELREPANVSAAGDHNGIDGGVAESARRVESGNGMVDGAGLPTVVAPAQPATEPVRLHSGIEAPRKLHDVLPVYPAAARATRTQGVVILEVTIREDGRVSNARVLRSLPGLDQAALDAVTQWTFAPARLNGAPIPVVMTVTVNFALF